MSFGLPPGVFLDAPRDTTVDRRLAEREAAHEATLAAIPPVPVEDDPMPSSRAPSPLGGCLAALAVAAEELPAEGEVPRRMVVYVARILRSHARRLSTPDRLDWLRVEELLRWQAGVFRAAPVPGLADTLDAALDAVTRSIHLCPHPSTHAPR